VMGRGIERKKIFRNNTDRNDFIDRLSAKVQEGAIEIYAWVLMPNHFHLVCKTKNLPLASSMRRILTGYVVNFNPAESGIIADTDIYFKTLAKRVSERYNVSLGELRSGGRRRAVVQARRTMSWIGVRELGYSGADVARYLGVTNSCVTRMISTGRKKDIEDIDLEL